MKRTFRNIGILATILLAVLFGPNLLERHRYYRPDKELWLKSEAKDRYYIAHYLHDHQSLLGLSRQEVLKMLGPPFGDSRFLIQYDLGPERLVGIDGVVFDVYFDGVGAASKAVRTLIRVT